MVPNMCFKDELRSSSVPLYNECTHVCLCTLCCETSLLFSCRGDFYFQCIWHICQYPNWGGYVQVWGAHWSVDHQWNVIVHTLDLLVCCVGTLNDAVFSCGDGRPVEELLEEASECNSDIWVAQQMFWWTKVWTSQKFGRICLKQSVLEGFPVLLNAAISHMVYCCFVLCHVNVLYTYSEWYQFCTLSSGGWAPFTRGWRYCQMWSTYCNARIILCLHGWYWICHLFCAIGTAIEEPCEVPKPRLDSTLSPNEIPFKGNQMPVDSSCTIVPHPCEVYSAKAWKCTRPFGSVGNFIRKGFKSSRRICLFGNVVCISSSTQDVIKYVVDLTKERLCLNGCDLTVGQWVVILPESKLSEWKAVSGEHCYNRHCIIYACKWDL